MTEINELSDNYLKECLNIRAECIKITWHMRGGINFDQALQLSYDDRRLIADLIKDNMEVVKKTGLPYF